MKELKPLYNKSNFPNNYRFILILVFLVLDGIAKIVLYKGLPDIFQQMLGLVEQIFKALRLI